MTRWGLGPHPGPADGRSLRLAGCLSNFAPLVPSREPGSIHIYSVNSENLCLKDGLDLSCQRVVWKSLLDWRKAEPRFAECEERTSSRPVHLEQTATGCIYQDTRSQTLQGLSVTRCPSLQLSSPDYSNDSITSESQIF